MSSNLIPLNPDEYKYMVISVFFISFIVIKVIQYLIEENRKKEIANYCKTNKIDYSLLLEKEDLAKSSSDSMKTFDKAIAVMAGNIDGYKYYLFDYVETTKSNNRGYATFAKSICVIYKENIDFPHFLIRDESILLDHIMSSVDEDINFSEDPTFSKKFILMGSSENTVRDFFDRKKRDSFVRKHVKGYIYEAYKNSFTVSVNKVLRLKERLTLLNNSINLFKDIVPEN